MKKIHFFIHDLVEVQVASNVNRKILNMLEFQLGSSKVVPDGRTAKHKINIRPYDDFKFEPNAVITNLWQTSGVVGSSYNNPKEKFALKKESDSFSIYADNKNFAINMFIQLALINSGVSLLPAAAIVNQSNHATLFAGGGGAGKTTLTLCAVHDAKYRLLGDDTICLSKFGYGLSYPRQFTIKEYHKSTYPEYFETSSPSAKHIGFSYFKKILKQIFRNLPFLGVTNSVLRRLGLSKLQDILIPDFKTGTVNGALYTVPLDTIYGKNKVVPRADIDKIVYLERYNGTEIATEPIESNRLASLMFSLLQNEWALSVRRLYLMSVLELFDLEKYYSLSREIIYSGIKGKQCERLLIPDTFTPEMLSKYFLSNDASC